MKIKAVRKMPRFATIPGDLTIEEYRALQAGEEVDVSNHVAQHLIVAGYAAAGLEENIELKTGGE